MGWFLVSPGLAERPVLPYFGLPHAANEKIHEFCLKLADLDSGGVIWKFVENKWGEIMSRQGKMQVKAEALCIFLTQHRPDLCYPSTRQIFNSHGKACHVSGNGFRAVSARARGEHRV